MVVVGGIEVVVTAIDSVESEGASTLDALDPPQLAANSALNTAMAHHAANDRGTRFTPRSFHATELTVKRSETADLVLHKIGSTGEEIADDRGKRPHVGSLEMSCESVFIVPMFDDDERIGLTHVLRDSKDLTSSFGF